MEEWEKIGHFLYKGNDGNYKVDFYIEDMNYFFIGDFWHDYHLLESTTSKNFADELFGVVSKKLLNCSKKSSFEFSRRKIHEIYEYFFPRENRI